MSDEGFTSRGMLRIQGWGKTDGVSSGGSDILQVVNAAEITNEVCAVEWELVDGATVLPQHICTFEGPRDSSICSGDSGGPVFARGKEGWTLVGISSWGISTCSNYPSVAQRVSTHRDWILGITGF